LSKSEAADFFAEVLAPYFRESPLLFREIRLRQLGLRKAITDPRAAAERHPVFEIWPR
jgi:hypothetical protein